MSKERLDTPEMPQDVASAVELLGYYEARLAGLQKKTRLDRSAVDQDEIDSLVCRVPALRNHVELLRRMAA
jgi:uncharacterized protein YciW